MNRSGTDVLANLDRLTAVTKAGITPGANAVGGLAWSHAALLVVVVLGALALIVWFLVHGESWDQRRPRLWRRRLPDGMGRRDTDLAESAPGRPFRQEPAGSLATDPARRTTR